MAFLPRTRYTTAVLRSHRSSVDPRHIRIVLITAPHRPEALRIARALVRRRLAACVNCVPGLRSVFHWQGRVDESNEALLIVKTTARRLPALITAVRRLHAYELPEILALPAAGGSAAYVRWVAQSCSPKTKK